MDGWYGSLCPFVTRRLETKGEPISGANNRRKEPWNIASRSRFHYNGHLMKIHIGAGTLGDRVSIFSRRNERFNRVIFDFIPDPGCRTIKGNCHPRHSRSRSQVGTGIVPDAESRCRVLEVYKFGVLLGSSRAHELCVSKGCSRRGAARCGNFYSQRNDTLVTIRPVASTSEQERRRPYIRVELTFLLGSWSAFPGRENCRRSKRAAAIVTRLHYAI